MGLIFMRENWSKMTISQMGEGRKPILSVLSEVIQQEEID
jgi:hypothetical protein